jgi:uncharacterized protein
MRQLLLILALLVAPTLWASRFDCSLEPPKARKQDKLVWNYAEGFLTASEEARINARLVEFARETSNQILLLVVDTLCGYPESDLAFEVGQKWGVGQKGFDNGIVFLIKPFGPPGQRVVFIATGYGLEGAIPDLSTKRVVDNEVLPNFREGRYHQGIDQAITVLMAMAKGEFDEKRYGRNDKAAWPVLLFFLLVMAIMVFSWRSSVKRYARTNNIDFWTAMFLLSQMQQKHRPRGGFRGGGGFGGGGGSGGFGGFGGGGFGGGGAGGRW